MGVQEITVFLLVAAAVFYSSRKFLEQFSQDGSNPKCAKCELKEAISLQKQHNTERT